MKTVKKIPELRFPEFEGEWKERKLGELTSKIGSGSTPRGGDEIYQTFGIPFIRSQNLVDNQLVLDETCIPVEIHNKMIGSKVYAKDVLLNITGASIGRSCVVPENFTEGNVNQHVSIIRLKRYNPKFLQLFISSSRGQKLIYEGQTGSGREGLNFESIKRFKVHFPSPEEQQKIASFLSSADQRIHLLTQKKEKLEKYKKGIMQQIFSQQLRFKDENGKDYPEWDYLKAKRVFKNHTNKNHNGDLPILSASQEHGMILREDGGIKIQSSDKSVLSYKVVEKDDFVISLRSFQGGIDYSPIYGICSPAYTVLRNTAPINPQFYRFFFKKESFIKRLSIAVIGIRDGKQISYETFGELLLPYPNIEEQQKIASFLSSLDQKISLVNQQIELTRKWKQGLLQKMFV